jgi:hypothetical protein
MGLAHDHGLLWFINVLRFGISTNEELEKKMLINI